MSTPRARTVLRWVHLFAGVTIATYVYSPWSALPWFDLTMKSLVLPGLVITGVWMWQQGRIQRWLRG